MYEKIEEDISREINRGVVLGQIRIFLEMNHIDILPYESIQKLILIITDCPPHFNPFSR